MKLKACSLRSKKRIYLVKCSSLKYTDLSVVCGRLYKSRHGVHSSRHLRNTGTQGIPAIKHQLLVLLALCGQLSRRFQPLTGDKQ